MKKQKEPFYIHPMKYRIDYYPLNKLHIIVALFHIVCTVRIN